ncbi:hypothetical protein BASA50_010222 [Batrachochytrium salamandrivorans]|uniref:RxLR effector protein n=1 Tax=Batrachochytrium salamandrivorans TaxID=1357716 RepID=A0ABQ8EZ42_9FUNG|nr:hypothetical protein BASA50_010222 [Batrachochytrium salamandrivorans]
MRISASAIYVVSVAASISATVASSLMDSDTSTLLLEPRSIQAAAVPGDSSDIFDMNLARRGWGRKKKKKKGGDDETTTMTMTMTTMAISQRVRVGVRVDGGDKESRNGYERIRNSW